MAGRDLLRGSVGDVGDYIQRNYLGGRDSLSDFTASDFVKDFYLRDYKNAARFTPRNNPVRQNFSGFVGFRFNSNLASSLGFNESGRGLTNHLSGLVKTSTLPSVQFKSTTHNQYNRKKINITGVDYNEIDVEIYDTVDSAWVILLMRYFAHVSRNPVNKYSNGVPRDLSNEKLPPNWQGELEQARFDSNEMGLDIKPQKLKSFFTHIDLVRLHARRAVQYTLYNPYIVEFSIGELDYSSSDPVMIRLKIAYENFTVRPEINFVVSGEDLERYDTTAGNVAANFLRGLVSKLPIELSISEKGRELFFLGQGDNTSPVGRYPQGDYGPFGPTPKSESEGGGTT